MANEKLADDLSSETDIDELRAWEAKNSPPKEKKKGDMMVRLPVGIFIMTLYILTYYAGPFYCTIFSFYCQVTITQEMLQVARKPEKDRATGILLH